MKYFKIFSLLLFLSSCVTPPSNSGADHAFSMYSGQLASNYGLGPFALPIALIPLIKNALYEYNKNQNQYDHEAEMEAFYQSRINYDYIPTGSCRVHKKYDKLGALTEGVVCKKPDGSWSVDKTGQID